MTDWSQVGVVRGDDGRKRCAWGVSSPDYVAYHDDEWGRPVIDDRRLYEKICLEGFQSGLSWLTILRKREGFRRAFAYYVDLFRSDLAPPMSNMQISNVWDEFGRGLFAFYVSGPWNIGEFRRRLPRERQGDWATAPLPGPDGPGVSTAGGSSLVIFRRSPRKVSAWRLVEYLSEPATMQRFHALTGNLPPRRSAWRAAALATDAPSQAFARQLERVRAAPKIPEWERIFQAMQLTAERVVARSQDIAEATTQLDTWVDALLEKRRWLRARAQAGDGRR